MGWQKINLLKYAAEVKRNMQLDVSDEIIAKDLLLTLVLVEFEKERGVFNNLIFKGGTLLSRNYLKYHRFSEDLDFVHQNCGSLRELTRKQRERRIKEFIDVFTPQLKKVADTLDLDFSADRSDTRYCSILHGRVVYIFRLYYERNNYIKIEINFVEKLFYKPKEVSVKAITDFFDSKELMFILGLEISNFRVLSYPIEEIILEKYRALLTRPVLKERDLFDLFLIPGSLNVALKKVVKKIRISSLIKKGLDKLIKNNLQKLKGDEFFKSDEIIADLAIVKYDLRGFEKFKEKIKPLLIQICELF
jgi:predicted nucleotidyltransferase component of viral defense system